MRYEPGESLDSWADRVQKYEYGHALMRLAEGDPLDKVMEEMSRRIVDKLKYPLIKTLQDIPASVVNSVESKERYEAVMKYHKPVADHVDTDT